MRYIELQFTRFLPVYPVLPLISVHAMFQDGGQGGKSPRVRYFNVQLKLLSILDI